MLKAKKMAKPLENLLCRSGESLTYPFVLLKEATESSDNHDLLYPELVKMAGRVCRTCTNLGVCRTAAESWVAGSDFEDLDMWISEEQVVVGALKLSCDERGERVAEPTIHRTNNLHGDAYKPTKSRKNNRDTTSEVGFKNDDLLKVYLEDIAQHRLLTKDDEVTLARRVQEGIEAGKRLAATTDNLSIQELTRLNSLIKSGEVAHRQFVEANLRLVVSIAKRYQWSGMDLLDLVQEGNLGLIHAVDKFEWRKGFKFSTYATWWIRQAITRGISNTGRTIRLPIQIADTLAKIQKARTRLEFSTGRAPTIDELAADTGLSVKKVYDVLSYAPEPISIFEPVGDDGEADLSYFIADKTSVSPEDSVLKIFAESEVAQMLAILGERERRIIELRFGLGGLEPMTLEAVGEIIGVTRERVRQIERRALSKLRHPVMPYELD